MTRQPHHRGKSALEIGDQVVGVFQANMETYVGPPGAHLVAVRYSVQSNRIARLSKPPQEKPRPNSVNSLRKACTDCSLAGLSTMLNRPQAPVKSRFQIRVPGRSRAPDA